MTISMGLIGHGIAKSRMAKLQMYLGQAVGVDLDYILIDGAARLILIVLKKFNSVLNKAF